ncbi:NADH dehydrogenase [ubiquinone] 1 alpha subcomplex assembly factor 2 [Polistes fuscatus]|uniref:NADH dehydrogenase [ubiquinone] 1 alpha subcomplex assembly factor 2 n=1 Tax=Polistes fuscatus TaxID=30207 RepID=UPI001CA9518C|nr:NADH dehydrogenase [ubiquinone] 1 alpha subcomplex assembly factor 2 [Polistes fuscatus]XP_043503663.1 NADH dehydrogenase [ubiquinone] 1 alpha subcomplex assembly factor 2 [Polistes fuscatus]
MSGRQRGLFQMIFRDFLASIKPTFNRPKLMGEDYYGTKYYEVAVKATSKKKLPSRYFKSINDDFEQELPAEWEAWLRYRRKEPPTFEEIEKNYKIAMIKKMNAEKIEAANKEQKALNETGLPVEESGYKSFPVYEEYNSTNTYNKETSKPKLK